MIQTATSDLIHTPYRELQGDFKTPISSKDKKQYDTAVFTGMRQLLQFTLDLSKLADPIDAVDANLKSVLHNQLRSINEVWSNQPIGRKLSIMVPALWGIRYGSVRLDKMPKSGLFCTRDQISSEWLGGFIRNAFTLVDKTGNDPLATVIGNVACYLYSYHNDIFYFNHNISKNTASFEVTDKLLSMRF